MGASGSKESIAAHPDPVDLRDHHALKSNLDEYAIELLKKAGYTLDHTLDDVTSGMAIVAVLFALVAQLWGWTKHWTFMPELKDTPTVLVPCVVVYFGLSFMLSYISTYVVKDKIAKTTSSPGMPGLTLYSQMKEQEDHYTLKLSMGRENSVRKEYLGRLYNEDGEIQMNALSVMVNELLHELDAPSESSNGDSKKDQ